MTSAWDPDRYTFRDARMRPALELLARVPVAAPGRVVDLGCGIGDVTRLLAERWPDATVVGVDSSSTMLARATASASRIDWVQADVATWAPAGPVDVLYSNAALHWVGDHDALLPRLVARLAAGGVLAVQMPLSHDLPSHQVVRDVLASFEEPIPQRPVATAEHYDALFAARGWDADVWETEYRHRLTGDDAVLEWISGTTLRPILASLDPARRPAFLDALRERLAAAYPTRADGTTVYPFRRLFFVVRG